MDRSRAAIQETLAEAKEYLAQGSASRLSESDTKAHFIEPMIAALGWRGIGTVTREYFVRNSQEYVDYVMSGPNGPLLAIEAKPIQAPLTDKNAAQLVQYCAVEGIEWAALTNGRELQFFNTFLRPDLAAKRLFTLNLISFNIDEDFGPIFARVWLLSRESLTAPGGTQAWMHRQRLSKALMRYLTDANSSAIRQLQDDLSRIEIPITPDLLADWFRSHLVTEEPSLPGSSSPERQASSTAIGEGRPTTTVAPLPRKYILTPLADHEQGTAVDDLKRLLGAGWYVYGDKTPTRKSLAEGDRICFYVAGKGVVAEAEVESAPERRKIPEADYSDKFQWAFRVRNVRLFLDAPIPIDAGLRARLQAFQGRDPTGSWAWYVQQTHTVTEHDFGLLVGRRQE